MACVVSWSASNYYRVEAVALLLASSAMQKEYKESTNAFPTATLDTLCGKRSLVSQ